MLEGKGLWRAVHYLSPPPRQNKPDWGCPMGWLPAGMLFAQAPCRSRGPSWGLSSSLCSIVPLPLQPLAAAALPGTAHPSSLALQNEEGSAGSSGHAGWAGWASESVANYILFYQPPQMVPQGPWWDAGGYR